MNPLLSFDGLPPYDRIVAADVVPALTTLVEVAERDFTAFEGAVLPTWAGSLGRLHDLTRRLWAAWGAVNHLLSVRNTPELRAAHAEVQPAIVRFGSRLGQSVPLYRALEDLRAGPGFTALDAVQQRVVLAELRDMQLSGVGLTGAARERFQAIQLELSDLSTRFSNQLLDAAKAWSKVLTDPAQVAGLPASLRGLMAHQAGGTPDAGPWKLTLDFPVYGPFQEHGRDRALREDAYRAFITRAAGGAHDNQPLLTRILALRQEQAALLGKVSYAEVSLASKMAPGLEAVDALLERLRQVARPKAEAELADLTAYARQASGDPALTLALWDIAFWAERLREERYAYTDEELRPYFALPQVLEGVFATAQRLFGITIVPADGQAPIWHPDVRYFEVRDGGIAIASFYLDPYSRPADKRGGAWMNSCLGREVRDGSLQKPVAILVCNQTPPVGDMPSLMTWREVETLFHEFGHGLQHLLTTVDHPQAAGINGVEWDAVELPSQFMENWCYDPATIATLARHYQSGAALPDALFRKVTAARTYRAASMTVRQVYLSALDLALHREPVTDPLAVQHRIAARTLVSQPLAEDRFLCSFSHIFAGGYAAGYYSYKWAEVLSADAFGAFTEAGLADPAAMARVGRRFRDTVLAQGGGRHPLEVFRDFRGRDPSADALLKNLGLL